MFRGHAFGGKIKVGIGKKLNKEKEPIDKHKN